MSTLAGRFAPPLLALAISTAFLAWSYAYEGRSHTVPMLIGWTALALCLLDLAAQTDSRAGRVLHGILSGRPLDSSSAPGDDASRAARPAAACAWVAGFVALVAVIGFIAAVPAYTLAFMRLQGRMSWRRSALTAVVVAAVVWVVFEQLLSYQVFEGALFGGQF